MLSLFKRHFLRALSRPIRTVPYSIALAVVALPLLQRFGGLSWDEAVTAVAVPMFLTYLFGRMVVRPPTAEQEAEMKRATADLKPIPFDIGFALVLLISLIALGSVCLASTAVYWALQLPFTESVLRFDRVIGRIMVYTVAYIGASLCWRWCMPLIKYQLYSLIATLFEFPAGITRRGNGTGVGFSRIN